MSAVVHWLQGPCGHLHPPVAGDKGGSKPQCCHKNGDQSALVDATCGHCGRTVDAATAQAGGLDLPTFKG